MGVKTPMVLSWMYQKTIREKLKIIDLKLIGPTTKFTLSYKGSDPNSYTTLTGKSKDILRVVLGGRSVAIVAKLPESFSSKKVLKPYISYIKAAFYALNYHEMGHVLFTDMTLEKLGEGVDPKYKGFVMNLSNILEDPFIEMAITQHIETMYPYDLSPRKFFKFMRGQCFIPQCESYKDTGDVRAFLQYLLLLLRCGKKAIPVTNAVFEKYKEELLPRIKAALSETDPTERQVKHTELAKWIIEHVEEFDWSTVEAPEEMKPMPKGSTGSPMKAPAGTGSSISEGAEDEGSEPSEGGTDESEKDDKEEKEGAEAKEEEKAEEEGPVKEFEEPEAEATLDECFDDSVNAAESHEFVNASESFAVKDESVLNDIEEQINKNKDCIDNISKFLTLFKGRTRPRRVSGFTSGKLDVFRAMQDDIKNGCDTKLFQRNVARGKMVDLAVSLLCDNSGSMTGTKANLASTAALALAQACEWANIPFECSCFTKSSDSYSGTSITIIEKEFDTPFEKAKPWFAINDDDLLHKLTNIDGVPCFWGNSEEVNLFYIWKKLQKVKHDTKLLFVFCDGCTTGSRDSLKSIVRRIEEDGIIVIGIGLCAREVANVYPHHKIFTSADDIRDNLAQYLVDTLSEYAL